MAVDRNTVGGLCLGGACCNQRFVYEWDEVGRLQNARRWDVASAGSAHDPTPTATADVELRYVYDGSDQRVVKTAVDTQGQEVHSVYAFGSLELRRAAWAQGGGQGSLFDYQDNEETEVVFLSAHGARLARLHLEDGLPALGGSTVHVLLELADHLGSGSIVIDRATSELAERMTYTAYGAAESDYRPGRWKAFREDYRFTGKEEDVEVGLQYFGKRYYAPQLGRWVSADPLTVHGAGADLNAYAYVHGAVLKAVDPVGLEEKSGPVVEKADLSYLQSAPGGPIPQRALVIPGRTGYVTADSPEYDSLRAQAKVELVHEAGATPYPIKRIEWLFGGSSAGTSGRTPQKKGASVKATIGSELMFAGAIATGTGQTVNDGATSGGIVGGTNPHGVDGEAWQAAFGAVNIASALGLLEKAALRGALGSLRFARKGLDVAERTLDALEKWAKSSRQLAREAADAAQATGRKGFVIAALKTRSGVFVASSGGNMSLHPEVE